MVVLLCLQIFFCRVLDVSLGTIRTILTVRGKKVTAAIIGFIEVFIWYTAVRSALTSDISVFLLAAVYAAGFASGTLIGGVLAGKFFGGIVDVQVITSRRDNELLSAIRAQGFAVSVLNVNSSEFGDEKYLLIIEIRSKFRKALEKLVRSHDPNAFITVRETKYIQNGLLK